VLLSVISPFIFFQLSPRGLYSYFLFYLCVFLVLFRPPVFYFTTSEIITATVFQPD